MTQARRRAGPSPAGLAALVSQDRSLLGPRGVSQITDLASLTVTNTFFSVLSASCSDGPIKLFCRFLSAKYFPSSPRFALCCACVCACGPAWAVGSGEAAARARGRMRYLRGCCRPSGLGTRQPPIQQSASASDEDVGFLGAVLELRSWHRSRRGQAFPTEAGPQPRLRPPCAAGSGPTPGSVSLPGSVMEEEGN